MIPYTKELPGDLETPITLYEKFVGDDIGFLLESKEGTKGRYSFIGKEPLAVLKGYDDEAIIMEDGKEIREKGRLLDIVKLYMSQFDVKQDPVLPFIGGCVGTISYDVIRQYEKLPKKNPDELGLPDVHLMFVKTFIVYDHFHNRIVLVTLQVDTDEGRKRAEADLEKLQQELSEPREKRVSALPKEPDKVGKIEGNISKEAFIDKVKKAKKYIMEGDIFQVVLSRRCSVEIGEDAFSIYRRLRSMNPSAYMFYLNFVEYQVVGSSPEMLVEVKGERILNCPIAGTRPRGADGDEDEKLAKELLEDEKERAEHVMLVDLARNDMGRIAEIGSVHVSEFMKVKYYSHVMHLVSLVEGKKNTSQDAFTILSSFLPAGTLSGAPKIRAMEIIEELEETKRGLYGGTVGYFGFDGNMDMCIAIRMMILHSRRAYLQAGAGIVADSVPEKEYMEIQNKLMALVKALGGNENDFTH